MGPTREGRKWAHPAWWHYSRHGSLPYRGVETSTGESTPTSIQHAGSIHGTDWQLRLPNMLMPLKKDCKERDILTLWLYIERGIINFILINHFLFKCKEPCKLLSCLLDFSLQYDWISIVWLFFSFFCNLQFLLLYIGTDKWMYSLIRNSLLCDYLSGWKTITFPLIWYIIYGYF